MSPGPTGPAGAAGNVSIGRPALKSITALPGDVWALSEAGRSGLFVWTAGNLSSRVSSDTLEAVYIAHATIPSTSGAWVRIYTGNLHPEWFGCVLDGVSDCSAALNAAGSLAASLGTGISATTGSMAINSNVTLTVAIDIRLLFNIANGVTLTLNGQITAPFMQVFSGAGTVVVNAIKNPIGYAEWFGARPDIDGFDSFVAITKTLSTFQEWRGIIGSYFTSDTIKLARYGLRMTAAKGFYDGTATSATRLVGMFNDRPVLRIGLDGFPGTVNAMPGGIVCSGWWIQQNQAPNRVNLNGCVEVAFARNSYFENSVVQGGMNGIMLYGSVDCRLTNVRAYSLGTSTGTGSDFYTGFYVNGNNQLYAGGNASVRLVKCSVQGAPTSVASNTAVYADHDFTDLFIEDTEVVGCEFGIAIDGVSTSNGPSDRLGNTDCQITHPVIDGFGVNAIRIRYVNRYGSVRISDAYGAPRVAATGAGISIQNCDGPVIVSGSQLLMWPGSTTNFGFECLDSNGVVIDDTNHVLDPGGAGMYVSGCNNSKFKAQITAMDRSCAAAVVVDTGDRGSNGNYFQPLILSYNSTDSNGAQFLKGINCVGAGNNYNEFNLTGLRSTMITGAKMTYNGHVITAAGPFNATGAADTAGLNTASGIMA